MKLFDTILFQKKQVALGDGCVYQYTVFENKKLFSLIFYKWYTINQIRFHTHAFNSFAFLLKGWYHEKVIFNGVEMANFVNQPLWPRFIPKHYTHAIGHAKPGTMTMVITGPWEKNWYEYFPDTKKWIRYGWGRQKEETFDTLPKDAGL